MTEERRGNIYIGSEKGQTRKDGLRRIERERYAIGLRPTAVVRPMKRREWDLTQEERRSKGVGSGMGVDIGNRLDARKRRGRGCVGSGMSVSVGNRLDARERKGRRCVGSEMR